MNAIRRQLASPAMIVACAALIVALGGVSYAATVLPKNSVGSAQLQKKAVTRAKLKSNAVTGAKVKNGSLMAEDFTSGQLPAGPQGPKGDPGASGAAGVSGYQRIEASGGLLNVGEQGSATASCPAGKKALSGGVGSDAYLGIIESYAVTDTEWRLTVRNLGPSASGFSVSAVCANVG